jgi:hypothetical protein
MLMASQHRQRRTCYKRRGVPLGRFITALSGMRYHQ